MKILHNKQKTEKIFINKNGNLNTFRISENIKKDKELYYKYIRNKKKNGYLQYLLDFDTMINIVLELLSKKDVFVSEIYLYNSEKNKMIKKEILSYFNKYYQNKTSAKKLKYDLFYYSDLIYGFKFQIKTFGLLTFSNDGILKYENNKTKNMFMDIINIFWNDYL